MSTLTIVGTPIGNLGDMSPRAVETLRTVDFIAAEDTRVTMKLLSHFGISKPLVSYYEHNRRERGEQIVARILAGESCALVTDAGMPAVSDPGGELVEQCREAGVPVVCVPGPSALITAYALSGLGETRFTFEGFLSVSKSGRREHLDSLKGERRAMIFYEAPHKLRNTLDDFAAAFGPSRPIFLARELTKLHEEGVKTTIGEAVEHYKEHDPRGEYVLIVWGKPESEADEDTSKPDPVAVARAYVEGGMSVSEAAKRAAKETGSPRGRIYSALLEEP